MSELSEAAPRAANLSSFPLGMPACGWYGRGLTQHRNTANPKRRNNTTSGATVERPAPQRSLARTAASPRRLVAGPTSAQLFSLRLFSTQPPQHATVALVASLRRNAWSMLSQPHGGALSAAIATRATCARLAGRQIGLGTGQISAINSEINTVYFLCSPRANIHPDISAWSARSLPPRRACS